MLVHKREAQLDYLEQVHVAAQQLVLIVSVASELSDWSGYYTWKLGVLEQDRQLVMPHGNRPVSDSFSPSPSTTHHSNVVVFSDNMSDPLQLVLQVVGPNLTYSLAVIHSSSGHSATSPCKEKDPKKKGLSFKTDGS